MDDSMKINMQINIGGQPVALTVPFDRQDFVRDIESEIDKLFATWRRSFPKKDDRELFAMIAYQYASRYKDLISTYEEALRAALKCDEQIDAINL